MTHPVWTKKGLSPIHSLRTNEEWGCYKNILTRKNVMFSGKQLIDRYQSNHQSHRNQLFDSGVASIIGLLREFCKRSIKNIALKAALEKVVDCYEGENGYLKTHIASLACTLPFILFQMKKSILTNAVEETEELHILLDKIKRRTDINLEQFWGIAILLFILFLIKMNKALCNASHGWNIL